MRVTGGELRVSLADGRRLQVPLDWFPRLANAFTEAGSHWRLLGDGAGIHWPDIDEDLSVEGLQMGARARRAR
ncbi:MAG: DUF2442 domain-containing protein [Candidatus Eisenbacteria bacterium]